MLASCSNVVVVDSALIFKRFKHPHRPVAENTVVTWEPIRETLKVDDRSQYDMLHSNRVVVSSTPTE